MNPRLLLPLACLFITAPALPAAFTAGAAVADVTPEKLPVLVNGGMLSRYADKIRSRLHARALALADGREQAIIVVVDSCMLPRPLLDEVKALAEKRTGIPRDRQLISATHTHTAPSSMGCLGTEPDADYLPFLRERLVEVIAAAQAARVPARIGFTKTEAGAFTALRQWIRRPDRLAEDPFGNLSVRANMHAGRNWDDATGESGPEDPDLSLISVQTREGKPLAVLGNFSMHYFGDHDLSADYFGLFCEGLKARLAPDSNFVGLLSHGCSGDIYRVDYKVPAAERPNPTIEAYADGLLDLAVQALAKVEHRHDVDLAMAETRLPMAYRVPDKQRLEWAQRVVAEMGDRPAKTQTEVYAREQLILHERQKTEVVVQALRVGDIGIATTPTETYAITGLKIKAASPLVKTMVIELANGGDGYIPPPEMHAWGGYNTWAARSAGLEVQAEPKITQAAIGLLETVSGAPRRPWHLGAGPATRAIADLQPAAYWRLNELNGPLAADASPHGRAAAYLGGIAYSLDGPQSDRFCAAGEINRAPHFVEGRLAAQLPSLKENYSIALWLWNGLPDGVRDVSGWFYSRDVEHGLSAFGEHLGVDGSGRLLFQAAKAAPVTGQTAVPRWTWQQVVLVREAETVRVYLNGKLEIETQAAPARFTDLFFGGRSDHAASWEGRLDEIAVFEKALSREDIQRLAKP
jgi:hypothetical protein